MKPRITLVLNGLLCILLGSWSTSLVFGQGQAFPGAVGAPGATGATGAAGVAGPFTQIGAGAVSQTQQSANQRLFSAVDFNAPCDGITNAAAGIQSAMNAGAIMGGGGNTVLLPTTACPSVYLTGTTTLTIPQYVTLQGAGRVATTIKYTGTGCAVSLGSGGSGTFHHGLQDLRIDLTGAGSGAVGICGVQTFYDTIRNISIITGITATNTGQTAIRLDGGSNFGTGSSFENISASGCFLYGIHLQGSTDIVSYTSVTFKQINVVQSCTSGTGMTSGLSLTNCTATNPSVCTATGAGSAFPLNSLVKVSGVTGTIGTAVNAYWNVSASTTNTITLEGSFGSGLAYTSGGTIQLATVGWWGWNGDQEISQAADIENFEVGVALNRTGSNLQVRLEGNTKDWLVTGNADGARIIGTFAPANTVDRGPATNWTTISPGLEASSITNLQVPDGLTETCQTGTGLNCFIGLSSAPGVSADVILSRNYAGNATMTTSSGNAFTLVLAPGSGQGGASVLNAGGPITYNINSPPTNSVVCYKAGGQLGWASNTGGTIGTTCN